MANKKFILISPKNRTVYNFRGDLIKSIQEKGYEVIVTGPNQDNIDKINELGVRFVEIPVNKTGTSIIGDLKYCKKLYELFKKEKPDATLGYTIKPVVYGSIAASLAKVKNINAMVTGAGYVFTAKTIKAKILGLIVKILYKYGFGKAHKVIFQNKDDLKEFTELGLVKKDKCYVVNGSGVNMEKFTIAPYPNEISFFMLSRLLKSKGVEEYLKACEIVKKQYPNVKFYLLGKYEYEMQDAVSQEFVEYFINNNIVERFEETNDVLPYYAKCSVYVLPSYREGTPRTVLEAMAMGRPIITTDTNGCRDTVIDGLTGFLVPIKSIDELVNAMTVFIENPGVIDKIGLESYKYCKEKFDVNVVNKNMKSIIFYE